MTRVRRRRKTHCQREIHRLTEQLIVASIIRDTARASGFTETAQRADTIIEQIKANIATYTREVTRLQAAIAAEDRALAL